MKDELIKEETAILAKQCGFDWEVSRHYGESPIVSHLMLCEPGDQFGTPYEPANYNNNKWAFKKYSAPTQSLLQRWLREVHNIHIEVTIYRRNGVIEYSCDVLSDLIEEEVDDDTVFFTYEAALEDALVTGVNILIECKNNL